MVANFIDGVKAGWLFPLCRFNTPRTGGTLGFRIGRWLRNNW